MSSSESSGAPAEATATTPANAEFPSFGSTRGSGLARGKRPTTGPAATTAAAPSDYKPTAIEVVNAPREYTNPFAPATPEPAEQPAASPAPAAIETPAATTVTPPAPVARFEPDPIEAEPAHGSDLAAAKSELNILPPAEQKSMPAQTWESDGFRPARESRGERPRREERREEPADESVDLASIPEKFLYVRPGVTFVPTPRNWGGAPRERHRPAGDGAPRHEDAPRSSYEGSSSPASAPAKSGGIFGWLKSLFGGSSSPAPVTSGGGDESRADGGERRHRGGRNRGGRGGEAGGQRRHRGGRGRGRSGGGEYGGGGPAST